MKNVTLIQKRWPVDKPSHLAVGILFYFTAEVGIWIIYSNRFQLCWYFLVGGGTAATRHCSGLIAYGRLRTQRRGGAFTILTQVASQQTTRLHHYHKKTARKPQGNSSSLLSPKTFHASPMLVKFSYRSPDYTSALHQTSPSLEARTALWKAKNRSKVKYSYSPNASAFHTVVSK